MDTKHFIQIHKQILLPVNGPGYHLIAFKRKID